VDSNLHFLLFKVVSLYFFLSYFMLAGCFSLLVLVSTEPPSNFVFVHVHAGATFELIGELRSHFPHHDVLNAHGIVYPQY
jgi:hypothetical protein